MDTDNDFRRQLQQLGGQEPVAENEVAGQFFQTPEFQALKDYAAQNRAAETAKAVAGSAQRAGFPEPAHPTAVTVPNPFYEPPAAPAIRASAAEAAIRAERAHLERDPGCARLLLPGGKTLQAGARLQIGDDLSARNPT